MRVPSARVMPWVKRSPCEHERSDAVARASAAKREREGFMRVSWRVSWRGGDAKPTEKGATGRQSKDEDAHEGQHPHQIDEVPEHGADAHALMVVRRVAARANDEPQERQHSGSGVHGVKQRERIEDRTV